MTAAVTVSAYVSVCAFVVSRLPDTTPDHETWSVRVEAAGHGRWAVRNGSRSLSKSGQWDSEPIPSYREPAWLERHRWDDVDEAIAAAVAAEPHVRWNGLTPADVLARQAAAR